MGTYCVPAIWWSQTGSNRRPLQCHCSALPAELWPRNSCWRRRYRSGAAGWQPSAVAFALVVLDLDLDLLGLVGEVVGILQRRVVGLDVRRFVLERGILRLFGL